MDLDLKYDIFLPWTVLWQKLCVDLRKKKSLIHGQIKGVGAEQCV